MNGNSYEMILWWSDEDAAYVVEVPELPGCMAHGKTRPEAIRQAEAAICLWIKTARKTAWKSPSLAGVWSMRDRYPAFATRNSAFLHSDFCLLFSDLSCWYQG
jgi:predicted RNase H-like HicB family nuclease